MTCQAVSVKATGNKYVVTEKCSGVAPGTQNTTYVMSNDILSATIGPSTVKYKRCGSTADAKAETEVKSENTAMTCKVIEGASRVITFLDAKLKKIGSTIRYFDDYTFKADKKFKLADTYALAGKLLNADGAVVEAKSFVYAGEWNCK